ncbi:hypothetical protein D9M71_779870 [compost metagenome]
MIGQQVTGCLSQCGIARGVSAAILRLAQQNDACILPSHERYTLDGGICAAVIDHDDFQIAPALREQAAQGRLDKGLGIECRHDHADFRLRLL